MAAVYEQRGWDEKRWWCQEGAIITTTDSTTECRWCPLMLTDVETMGTSRPGGVNSVVLSILLQFTLYQEYTVTVWIRRELLNTAVALEALCRPTLCQDHVDLEAVSDLISEGRVIRWGTKRRVDEAQIRTSM